MSFISKIKQQLGIGTVKIKLDAPNFITLPDFNKEGINGKVILEEQSS